jgi:hypothetical protein
MHRQGNNTIKLVRSIFWEEFESPDGASSQGKCAQQWSDYDLFVASCQGSCRAVASSQPGSPSQTKDYKFVIETKRKSNIDFKLCKKKKKTLFIYMYIYSIPPLAHNNTRPLEIVPADHIYCTQFLSANVVSTSCRISNHQELIANAFNFLPRLIDTFLRGKEYIQHMAKFVLKFEQKNKIKIKIEISQQKKQKKKKKKQFKLTRAASKRALSNCCSSFVWLILFARESVSA